MTARWILPLVLALSACTVTTPPSPVAMEQGVTPSPLAGGTVEVTVPPAPTEQSTATVRPITHPAPTGTTTNLDLPTQAAIARAKRVVFVVPFSHWDTDWHDTFTAYAASADRNILDAIALAKADGRFRYAFEQVLFVQHFWSTHPEAHGDLVALVHRRQLTFAWAGITQPETSLAAPSVQVRNLALGQEWIAQVFGPEFVPHTAWQSDAFGNNAALPIFLAQSGIRDLFIGRWQHRCDPDYDPCTPLPHLFQWNSPAAPSQHVLVAYGAYSQAFGSIERLTDEGQEIAALQKVVDGLAARTDSKYLFLPFGDDFWSPPANLMHLIDRWNGSNPETVAVVADPATAFDYTATRTVPAITTDLNPIWQAFYGTRPAAKIADKESEFYLTAADKFGLLLHNQGEVMTTSTAWYTATVNAHYDNIGAVSFDRVWEASQRPRFEQTVATSARDLSRTLSAITGRVAAPFVVFNPLSWQRSGVVELQGNVPDAGRLPQPIQRLGPGHVAVWLNDVPAVGYRVPPVGAPQVIAHPAVVSRAGQQVQLSNGIVSLTIDAEHGGTLSQLQATGGPPLLQGYGDDVTYLNDHGDVYGGFFGAERGRESGVPARLTVLATGPLVARVEAVFELGGQPITKTITLEANSPRIDVILRMAALPETTAIVQVPTTRHATVRTDDLGFAAFAHPVDNSPIVSGTVTYRREVFYPISTWSDIAADGAGLTLLTHGLQGLGGMQTLNLMVGRSVSDRNDEGVSDLAPHTLRYAYVPHAAGAAQSEPWQAAYAFNQPLIAAWRSGEQVEVQLPWAAAVPYSLPASTASAAALPSTMSLLSAANGIVADVQQRGDQMEAVVLNYDQERPTTLTRGARQFVVPAAGLSLVPLPRN